MLQERRQFGILFDKLSSCHGSSLIVLTEGADRGKPGETFAAMQGAGVDRDAAATSHTFDNQWNLQKVNAANAALLRLHWEKIEFSAGSSDLMEDIVGCLPILNDRSSGEL